MPPAESQRLALVVEDNPDNMLLTRAVLRLAGYNTAEARSAEEAIEQLGICRPDLVLMDIQLSGQDGLSLTRQLRSDPRQADIPIIALSAHAMRGSQEEAEAAGCDGYITKPIDTRAFAAQLQAALEASQRRTGQL